MEDLVGFVIIGLFVDVIFWGVSYATGCLLIPILSLGKWQAESILKDEGGKLRKQNGFTLIERSGELYLGAFAVAFSGILFWSVVVLLLCIT